MNSINMVNLSILTHFSLELHKLPETILRNFVICSLPRHDLVIKTHQSKGPKKKKQVDNNYSYVQYIISVFVRIYHAFLLTFKQCASYRHRGTKIEGNWSIFCCVSLCCDSLHDWPTQKLWQEMSNYHSFCFHTFTKEQLNGNHKECSGSKIWAGNHTKVIN